MNLIPIPNSYTINLSVTLASGEVKRRNLVGYGKHIGEAIDSLDEIDDLNDEVEREGITAFTIEVTKIGN